MKIAKKGTYGYRRWHQTRLMLSAVLLGGLMYYLFTLSLRVQRPPRLSAMPTRSSLKIAELCSTIASL